MSCFLDDQWIPGMAQSFFMRWLMSELAPDSTTSSLEAVRNNDEQR